MTITDYFIFFTKDISYYLISSAQCSLTISESLLRSPHEYVAMSYHLLSDEKEDDRVVKNSDHTQHSSSIYDFWKVLNSLVSHQTDEYVIQFLFEFLWFVSRTLIWHLSNLRRSLLLYWKSSSNECIFSMRNEPSFDGRSLNFSNSGSKLEIDKTKWRENGSQCKIQLERLYSCLWKRSLIQSTIFPQL